MEPLRIFLTRNLATGRQAEATANLALLLAAGRDGMSLPLPLCTEETA